MGRRRYISTDISLDPAVQQLIADYGEFAGLLYSWMVPHADDTATITGEPQKLLFMVVPGLRHRTAEDVAAALDGMEACGLIAWDRAARVVRLLPKPYVRFPLPGRTEWNRLRDRVSPIVFRRDGRRCRACGSSSGPFQIDHVVPIARGGSSDLDNLQVLCASCNASKGSR